MCLEDNMKHNMSRLRATGLLLLFLLSTIIPFTHVSAKEEYKFSVSLSAGYNNQVLVGYSAPVTIHVTNDNLKNFEGYIQMIVINYENNNILYEEELTLGSGEDKVVEMVSGFPIATEYVNIRMTDKKHKLVWSELERVNFAYDKETVRVGVLTDDFSALSYMDRQHFLSAPTMTMSLIPFTEDTFPSDYHALDTIDTILITDFSTDILTKEQINALNLWVQDGGLLIIGTGSTANKTLAGINGKVVNVNLGKSQGVTTTLGLENWDYSYVANILSTVGYNGQYNSGSAMSPDPWNLYVSNYYDDDYSNKPWKDDDGDGINDYVYEGFKSGNDANGNFIDSYGNLIAPDYYYLFENNAYEVDPNTSSIHYKYYDEKYGIVDYNDPDYQNYVNDPYWSDDDKEDMCYDAYCHQLGYDPKWWFYENEGLTDPDDINREFRIYFGTDFQEFMDHFLYNAYYYYYYSVDLRPDLTVGSTYTLISSDYTKINVDTVALTLEGSENADSFVGDSTTGDYDLARLINVGNGKIIVAAVDFTKNPIPKTDYASELVRNMIEKTIGLELIQEAYDYADNAKSSYSSYNGSSYDLRNLLKKISSAPYPPVLIYGAILIAYLVLIFVLYIVLLKKKKTSNLWKIYPVAAFVFSILIFCIGFSTRVLRLNVNVLSIITPGEVVTKEVDYVSATVPKKKEYLINFEDDVEVDKSFMGAGSYHWYSSTEPDYDTYTIQYREGYDNFQSVITNKVGLESEYYKAETVYPTAGGIEISYLTDPAIVGIDPANIRVTNNYSTTLQDVMVVINTPKDGYRDFYFKSIKSGESYLLNQGEEIDDSKGGTTYSSSYYSNNAISHYQKHVRLKIVKGILFGDLHLGDVSFSELRRRWAGMDYIYDQSYIDSDHMVVTAFPQSEIGSKVVKEKGVKGSNGCKVNRVEMIWVNKAYTDIKIKKQTN